MPHRNSNSSLLITSSTSNSSINNQSQNDFITSPNNNEISTNSNSNDLNLNQDINSHNNLKQFLTFDKIKNINSILKKEFNELRHAVENDIDKDEDYHNKKQKRTNEDNLEARSVVIERQGGLANPFVLLLLFLWYFFSAFTLYTNKYIVSSRKSDPTLVGTAQMIVTSLCGFMQLKKTLWSKSSQKIVPSLNNSNKHHYFSFLFWRNMFIIGLLRLFSIVLGLMALKQAAISFVETVKSSSPIFTVIVSRFLIGEITGFWTKIALFPIMFGLALCSSFEINFSFFGFMSAILTNFTECLQNVFSKLLLCSDLYKFTPLEVQFFSSVTSVLVLVPTCYFTSEFNEQSFSFISFILYIINGVSFHAQTLLAFTLMSYISPVTYRFSVYIFQNQVGYMSAIGTFFVIIGVLLYNQAKNIDKQSNKDTVTHKI